MEINLVVRGDKIAFQMTYDPNFWADIGMREYLLRNNLCEPETVHVLHRVLRPGDTVIDGGANVGFFTVIMSKLVGPTGKVIAFEPGVNNHQKFADNMALNNVQNVELIKKPLWSEKTTLDFHMQHDSGLNSIAVSSTTLCKIPLETAVLSDYSWPKLIKLDIEGAEQHALSALGGFPPFIIAECFPSTLAPFGHSQESLRQMAKSKGYDMFIIPQDGSLPIMVPPATVVIREMPPPIILFSTIEEVGKYWDRVDLK